MIFFKKYFCVQKHDCFSRLLLMAVKFSWIPSSTSIIRLWFFNQTSGFPLINFLLSTISSLGDSFIIFSAIDDSSPAITFSWLYPFFFLLQLLEAIASGNLQRSIISWATFSIIKAPSSSLKSVLYFCFSSSVSFFTAVFFDSL